MLAPAKRPTFLHLLKIAMPVTALASFAHRISGVLLVLASVPLIYTLQLSLRDPAGFARVHAIFSSGAGRLVLAVLGWALAHHLLAGLRFLAQDLGFGLALRAARLSAWCVNVCGILFLTFALWRVWP